MYTGKTITNYQDQHVIHHYENLVKNEEVVQARKVYEANADLREIFNQINEQYGHQG